MWQRNCRNGLKRWERRKEKKNYKERREREIGRRDPIKEGEASREGVVEAREVESWRGNQKVLLPEWNGSGWKTPGPRSGRDWWFLGRKQREEGDKVSCRMLRIWVNLFSGYEQS